MAQTVCYVFPDDAEWKIELGRESLGSYPERQTAINAAVEATRSASLYNPHGAEVRVAEGIDRWHTAWSLWSAKRTS